MLDDSSTSDATSTSDSSSAKEEVPRPLEDEEPNIIQGKMPCWCTRCKGSVVREAYKCFLYEAQFGRFEVDQAGASSSTQVCY